MNKNEQKYFDIQEAKKAYAEGKNITELLRAQKQSHTNTSEIIEVSYDLQAGTYIDFVEKNPEQPTRYAAELAQILNQHIRPKSSLLDIGTGELTTLSMVFSALNQKPSNIFAFDISWSRINKGLNFAQKYMKEDYKYLIPFVGDISEIPLLDKSINITTSSHALEPNGGNLKKLMLELFRVTADKLILFEPCYEINSEEGKARMDRLGYIKNIDGVAEELGGKIIEKITIKNGDNPLNPTVCFIIQPPKENNPPTENGVNFFSVPGTNFSLKKVDDFFYSNQVGLCFPILKNIPILKASSAILATSLLDQNET
jgi:ubiquinone/menaquinone biosynthesis C-methylase UbiE